MKQFTTTLDTDAKKSMKTTMEYLIKQHMEEQIEQLDQQATEMLVTMEETFYLYSIRYAPIILSPVFYSAVIIRNLHA